LEWTVNGIPQGGGVNPINVVMNAGKNAQAVYGPISPYVLTIITTSGGTTNPLPGSYNYSSGSTVQVTAVPNSGYVLSRWEFDGANVSSTINPVTITMNMSHTIKAVFSLAPPGPSVSIDPLISSIPLGPSVVFTSTVSGGTAPFSYQWFVDGYPVMGATASSWTFTPPTYGIYYVNLKVTDANNNSAYSILAQVIVAQPAVGGYSVPLTKQVSLAHVAAYTALVSLFGAVLIARKRKRK
jgi:hypothetical protein